MSAALDYLDKLKDAGRIDGDAFLRLRNLISDETTGENRELEYGWEWVSNPSTGPYVIHGSDSKESAERAMRDSEIKVAPIRIMVRDKATPGEWREA